MNKFTIILIVLVVLGLIAGLYVSYKMIKAQRQVKYLQTKLAERERTVNNMLSHLDRAYDKSMIFLHHSVGQGFLTTGGLQDSLLELGIVVRGATYGDEIGQQTDINHWLPKFDNDFDRILTFKAHPDQYFEDDRTNDIIMFKSCFPNSGLVADGNEGDKSADPTSPERTLANYQATFEALIGRFANQPSKLFVYWTSPPLNRAATTADEAGRARKFNDWLVNKVQADSSLNNLVVYNLFDFLADENGFLKAAYGPKAGADSHPNAEASRAVAADFMNFYRPIWETWNRDNEE